MQRLNELQDPYGVDVNLHVLASATNLHIQAVGREDEMAILQVPVDSFHCSGYLSMHVKLHNLLTDWPGVLPCKLLILGTSAAVFSEKFCLAM